VISYENDATDRGLVSLGSVRVAGCLYSPSRREGVFSKP
jgi:hypothetical protein